MGAIIPLITYLVWWYGFNRRLRDGYVAFFIAAAAWGSAVFVLSETLSLCHALSFFPLFFGWSLLLAATIYFMRGDPWPDAKDFLRLLTSLTVIEKTMLFFIVSVVAIKAYSALMSAPNTADAMTYHLARVEHWIQDQSVTDYPTHVLRQLYYPVFSEYIMLNLMI